MTLNPDQRPVPEILIQPQFVVRRQHLSDNDADYAAVMDSREHLRVWSDSTWPEDDFSPAANLDDLHMHTAEHARDEAYGYSIFTPDGQTLLGSVYLSEVAPFLTAYHASDEQRRTLAEFQVRVEYWLRRGVTPPFERAFLAALRRWLGEAWWFTSVCFGSRRLADDQRQVYEQAGLCERVRLRSLDGAREFVFHTDAVEDHAAGTVGPAKQQTT